MSNFHFFKEIGLKGLHGYPKSCKSKFTSVDITSFAWKTYHEMSKNTQKHNKKERKTEQTNEDTCIVKDLPE